MPKTCKTQAPGLAPKGRKPAN